MDDAAARLSLSEPARSFGPLSQLIVRGLDPEQRMQAASKDANVCLDEDVATNQFRPPRAGPTRDHRVVHEAAWSVVVSANRGAVSGRGQLLEGSVVLRDGRGDSGELVGKNDGGDVVAMEAAGVVR